MKKKNVLPIYAAIAVVGLALGFTAGYFAGGEKNEPIAQQAPQVSQTTAADTPEDKQNDTTDSVKVSGSGCKAVVDAVIASGLELPNYMYVEDKTMLSDVMEYDISLAEDYCSVIQMISADLFEITLMKPADGQKDAVLSMLESRKDYLINNAAFYPSQVEAAQATVTGSSGGYCYLLCAKNSKDIEKKLIEAIVKQNLDQ